MAPDPSAAARVRARLAPVWAPAVVTLLLMGPVLLPGYLLTYDMVWVPDLALRRDFFGLGSGVPRAVPSDAWVAVLDEVVPGMVLQKLVLVGSLLVGGIGIQAWVTKGRVSFASTAAATFYLWNPYVVERLAIGHWPMLVCYGLLPWIGRSVMGSLTEGRVRPGLLVLLPLASLNASAGIAAAVVVAAFAVGSTNWAVTLRLSAVVLVANLPWITAGVVNAGVLSGITVGAEVFAPTGEGSLPAPLTALTLGGIWNTEVVPVSRTTVLAWVSLVVVVVALVIGRRRLGRRELRGWWVCGLVGWSLAVLGWAAPGVIDWLGESVPGAGVLRDGSRLLLLLAPLLAVAVGEAVDRLVGIAGEAGPVIGAFAVLVPVAVLPDAIWGAGGDLEPVNYPSSYVAMAKAVDEVHRGGDVLVLPFTAYRAPEWNNYRKVFDPVGRFQDEDYVAADSLAISGRQLASEDPRGRRVLAALTEPTVEARSLALANLGISVVVIDRVTAAIPGQENYTAELAGKRSPTDEDFDVIAVASPRSSPHGVARIGLLTMAWLTYAGLLLAGAGGLVRRMRQS